MTKNADELTKMLKAVEIQATLEALQEIFKSLPPVACSAPSRDSPRTARACSTRA